jgi:spore coat polysaccharide biosynthesis protein SpsF (cytidylyltransferase family)
MKPRDKRPVVAIIQARMGSERLPGKVMLDIEGQTMLARVVRRVQQAKSIDDVVVATTSSKQDDVVADEGTRLGVRVTRGSEEDVLDRFRQAATESGAATIVRVSADSPLVDPEVTDMVVDAYMSQDVDYASNKLGPSFPLGLDVEAFSRDALEKTWKEASEPYERSHVTVRMYSSNTSMNLLPVTTTPDRHDWRWTVDTPEDLEFAREVFRRMGEGNDFSWQDVVTLIEENPEVAAINSHLKPKAIELG